MTAITIEALGISKDELTEKLLDRLVEDFSTEVVWDEDGEPVSRRSTMSKQITAQIKEHIEATVQRLGDEHVLPKVSEIVEGLVIQKTNEWGERKGEPISFIEYLVKCAEEYIREPVDSSGKSKAESGGYSWSKSTTRIAYMVDKHLHYSISKAMQKAIDDANAHIVGGLEAAVKHALTEAQKKLSVTVKC